MVPGASWRTGVIPVAALVLAAGTARRFGADKRLARLPSGQRVLEATVAQCLRAALPTLVVIDRSDDGLGYGRVRHCGRS